MFKMSIGEQYKTLEWQRKSFSIIQRDGRCVLSNFKNGVDHERHRLEVHHLRYPKPNEEKMIWEVKDNHLVTLCQKCHDSRTELNHFSATLVDDLNYDSASAAQTSYFMYKFNKKVFELMGKEKTAQALITIYENLETVLEMLDVKK